MNRYHPDQTPDPAQWLELDEQERISLVEEYHRRAGVKLPDVRFHALFHMVVENQIAENVEAVVRAIARLTKGGLSRHDAVHAVGQVLSEHMYDILNAEVDKPNPQADYEAAVERLTAKRWRKGLI